jgi:hypothetical protein
MRYLVYLWTFCLNETRDNRRIKKKQFIYSCCLDIWVYGFIGRLKLLSLVWALRLEVIHASRNVCKTETARMAQERSEAYVGAWNHVNRWTKWLFEEILVIFNCQLIRSNWSFVFSVNLKANHRANYHGDEDGRYSRYNTDANSPLTWRVAAISSFQLLNLTL